MELCGAAIILSIMHCLSTCVLCRPNLTSSIGSLQLSGEQCPGVLTLTCDAVNFGTSGTIDWFVNDTRIARYDVVDGITIDSPDLNVTIGAPSNSSERFDFLNFTLSANKMEYLSIQGRNITCGHAQVTARSEVFRIGNFYIVEEPSYENVTESVRYWASYDLTGKLIAVSINWNDTVNSKCNITEYSGVIQYENEDLNVTSQQQCLKKKCSLQFDIPSTSSASILLVQLFAGRNGISNTTIESTVGSSIDFKCDENNIIVHCSNRTYENCTIQYKMREDILPPGSTKVIHYSPEIQNIKVIVHMESTTLQQEFDLNDRGSCSQPSSRTGLIVGVVIAVVVVVVAIGLVVAVVVAKFIPYKNKHQEIGNLDYASDGFDIEKINLDELSIDNENEMVVYKATRKMYDVGLSEGSHKDIGEGFAKMRYKISEEINDKLKKALQEHRRKMKEDNGNYGTANFNRPTPSAASYSAAGYASLDRRDAKDPIKDKDNNEYHRLHELEKEKNDNTRPPVDSEYSQLNPGDQPIQDTTPTA